MDTRGAEQQCLQHFSIVPYDGPTQNERFHGFGSMTLTGQHEYAGMFKEGRRNGLGTMSWADGLKYVGPWVKNSATGQGALSWPNGTEYFGDVVKGKRHGNGVLFHGDNFYAGDWHCGKRHGFGLQVSPHVSYNGEWVDGSRHGWGVATFASGNVYCGCWENDAMHGYGSMTWVTDKSATTMDQVEAPNDAGGKELFIDAAAATAANRDYIRKLRSRLTNVGTICPGPLGPYTPSCVAHASMYERYTGAFEGNLPHGVGQYESYFFDGDTRDIPFDTVNQYNGSFERGVRSGHGVQKYADGTMYSGQWSANMKHGQGSIIHPDGTSDEVRMELDAPQRHNSNRPTTGRSSLSVTSEQNAAVEDSLELDDLFLTKQDRAALKELLTRYKSSLKHLFICYSKLWSPDDLASKAQRMMQEDAKVPAPRWDHRVDSDIRDMVALGTAPQISNTELVLRMTRRAEQAARDAAERAMAVVAEATELHKVNAKERRADDDAGDSDNEHDDFTMNITANSRHGDDSASPKRNRKRPATPLNESGMIRSSTGRPPAPPLAPQRRGKLSSLSRYQFLALLRDALILDAELTVTAVNDIVFSAIHQHTPLPAVHPTVSPRPTATTQAHKVVQLFDPADNATDEMSFRTFVECIVRIAEAKFSLTSAFAVPTIIRRWGIADRLEFLLDHFLEPLRTAMSETELSNELRSFEWPTFLADAAGDHTLEELRRYAYRVVQREQSKAVAAAAQPPKVTIKAPGSSALGRQDTMEGTFVLDEPGEVVMAPPLAVEEFSATVSDRMTFPMCPNSGVEIVTVDVTSTKGIARCHQLYFLKQNAAADGQLSSHFGGVVPSYHPAVSTVDVYDVLAALPTSFLHLSSALRPAMDAQLRCFLKLYQSCCSSDTKNGKRNLRANFGVLINYLQRRGFFDTEPIRHKRKARRTEDHEEYEGEQGSEHYDAPGSPHSVASIAPSVTIVEPVVADAQQSPPPTVDVEAFVRVCWEMEFCCFVPIRPEYCCPSVFLERKSLITSAIYEDPSFKPLLRVSPDLQDAVAIAVKRTEQWNERRRMFLDAPAAQQGLDAPGSMWWLVSSRMDLTFQQLVNIVIRLALTLYGTTDPVTALMTTATRIEAAERAPTTEFLEHVDVPPPSMVDELLPIKRSANPTPAAAVDPKKKPVSAKK